MKSMKDHEEYMKEIAEMKRNGILNEEDELAMNEAFASVDEDIKLLKETIIKTAESYQGQGDPDFKIQKPKNTNTIAIITYGVYILEANSVRIASFVC